MKYTINNLVMAHGTGHLFEQVGRPGVSEEPPGSQTSRPAAALTCRQMFTWVRACRKALQQTWGRTVWRIRL